MKLTALRHTQQADFSAYSVRFESPGGLIGSTPESTMVLPDEHHKGCIHAALRIESARCRLLCLSSMSAVSLNGKLLQLWETAELREGDLLQIGQYQLRAEGSVAVPDSVPESAPSPPDEPIPDRALHGAAETSLPGATGVLHDRLKENPSTLGRGMFAGLLGPGTLPVGGALPDTQAHPFSMGSAIARNTADSLTGLPPAALSKGQAPDLMSTFSNPDHQADHILSDSTPTVLTIPAAQSSSSSPILEILAAVPTKDVHAIAQRHTASEYRGGHLRPPVPKD